MVKKGIISVIDDASRMAEVIIPDLDDVVTPMIPISREIPIEHVEVGAKCVVAMFSDNFADCAVISIV